MVSNSRT